MVVKASPTLGLSLYRGAKYMERHSGQLFLRIFPRSTCAIIKKRWFSEVIKASGSYSAGVFYVSAGPFYGIARPCRLDKKESRT